MTKTPPIPSPPPAQPTTASAKILAWILVLQILTLIGQWAGPRGAVGGAAPALAQVPDAGAQRDKIIDQLKGTNQRLDRLIDLLNGGNLQVKIAKSDTKTAQ